MKFAKAQGTAVAANLSKFLRKQGLGARHPAHALAPGAQVTGRALWCVGANISFCGLERFNEEEARELLEKYLEVLNASGRYAVKINGEPRQEQYTGWSWSLHVESLRFVRSDQARDRTCFPGLR